MTTQARRNIRNYDPHNIGINIRNKTETTTTKLATAEQTVHWSKAKRETHQSRTVLGQPLCKLHHEAITKSKTVWKTKVDEINSVMRAKSTSNKCISQNKSPTIRRCHKLSLPLFTLQSVEFVDPRTLGGLDSPPSVFVIVFTHS